MLHRTIYFTDYMLIPRQFQNNNFDCGPFVCGYAVQLSNDKSLMSINIDHIRLETIISDSKNKSKLKGLGPFVPSSTIIGQEFVTFSEQLLLLMCQDLIKCRRFLVLNPLITKALATNNSEIITEYLAFKYI